MSQPIALFRASVQRYNPVAPTNVVLDASDEYLAFIFQADVTGPVLTRAAIRPGVLTGSSPMYVLALEGVTQTTAHPDGTVKGGANPVSVDIAPAGAVAGVSQIYSFANAYDSSPGEWLALTIRPKAGTTINASNCWSFTRTQGDSGTPRSATYLNGAAASGRGAAFAVGSATNWWGQDIANSYAFSSAFCSFDIPADWPSLSCVGFWAFAYGATSTSLASVALTGPSGTLATIPAFDQVLSFGQYRMSHFFWGAPATLSPGATYVFDTRPSGSGSYFAYSEERYTASELLLVCEGHLHKSTDESVRPLMGPLVSDAGGFIVPASGGGGPVIGSPIIQGGRSW